MDCNHKLALSVSCRFYTRAALQEPAELGHEVDVEPGLLTNERRDRLDHDQAIRDQSLVLEAAFVQQTHSSNQDY